MSKLLEKQFIFSKNVAKLLLYINSEGYEVTLGEAYRTKEQAIIYAKQGSGIVNSQHCKRLAIDLNIFALIDGKMQWLTDSKDYKKFGDFWERLNHHNRWGGHFNDGNHFEMK